MNSQGTQVDPLEIGASLIDRTTRWLSPFFVLGAVSLSLWTWHFGGGLSASLPALMIGVILVAAFAGGRLAPLGRILIYSSSIFLLGMVGVWRWGLFAAGHTAILLALIFASLLGLRRWLVALAIVAASLGVAAAGWVTGWFSLQFDPVAMLHSPLLWSVASLGILAGGISLIWEELYREVLKSNRLLRQSEEKFRSLVETTTDWIWEVDTTGTYTYASPQVRTLLGYEPGEVIGRTPFDFMPPAEAARLRSELTRLIAARQPFSNLENVNITRDGRLVVLETSGTPILDGQGQFLGYRGIDRDITARKQTEAALRESEEKLRSLVEQAFDAIILTDSQGVIIECNRATEQLTGYPRSDILGRLIWDVQYRLLLEDKRSPAVLEQIRALACQAFHTGEAPWLGYPFEGELQRPNGSRRYFQQVTFPIQSAQGFMIGSFTRDITEHKQAEAEREQLITDLESKNAELERFVYTASHDLKSPLVTIKGFLGWLNRDIAKNDRERVSRDLAHIDAAVNKMRRLLDDLLELSRIGRVMNPPQASSFGELCQEAVDLVAGRIDERGVEVAIAPDLPAVYGDRTRLLELLQNLLDNAVKFMGDQPKPRVELGARTAGGETIFFVRDNGLGIAPLYHQKVFDLFERLDPAIEGTGVGLALVKRIVETHGGRVWVESAGPGQGSTFCFTLAPGDEG